MKKDFLAEIAAARLPKMTYRPKEISAIKALAEAGLLIASFSERDGYGEIPYAQVIAVTEQGHRWLRDGRAQAFEANERISEMLSYVTMTSERIGAVGH